jgi:pyrophosphatase PpaX
MARFTLSPRTLYHKSPFIPNIQDKGIILWYNELGDDMAKLDTILYDLDGTLVDSNELILSTFQKTFEIHFPSMQLTRADYLGMMGPPLKETFHRFTKESQMVEDMIHTYLTRYKQVEFEYLSLYDGMKEAMEYFHKIGIKQAVVTTKFRDSAMPSILHFGLHTYLQDIIALEDVVCPKPDPEPLYLAMKRLCSVHAVMIGDNSTDIESGKNAKIPTLGVLYSLKLEELKKSNPDGWIQNGFELIQWVKKYNQMEGS